jgi:hypothetical protein
MDPMKTPPDPTARRPVVTIRDNGLLATLLSLGRNCGQS